MKPLTKKAEKLILDLVENNVLGIIQRLKGNPTGSRYINLERYLPVREKIMHYLETQGLNPFKKSKKEVRRIKKALANLRRQTQPSPVGMPVEKLEITEPSPTLFQRIWGWVKKMMRRLF